MTTNAEAGSTSGTVTVTREDHFAASDRTKIDLSSHERVACASG
jgi:hypothetical protein